MLEEEFNDRAQRSMLQGDNPYLSRLDAEINRQCLERPPLGIKSKHRIRHDREEIARGEQVRAQVHR